MEFGNSCVDCLPPPTTTTNFRVASFVISFIVGCRTLEDGTNEDTQGSMFVLTWFQFRPVRELKTIKLGRLIHWADLKPRRGTRPATLPKRILSPVFDFLYSTHESLQQPNYQKAYGGPSQDVLF